MALPYPTKVVLPFDIATAQDMNERHANDVALANGSGLDDGAVTADKLDFTTLAFGNYSTSEVDTGFKWVDGKAIYKKTINFGALPNNTTKNVAHGVPDIDRLVNIEGSAYSGTILITLPYAHPSGSIACFVSGSNITVNTGTDRSGYTGVVTIWYTKT